MNKENVTPTKGSNFCIWQNDMQPCIYSSTVHKSEDMGTAQIPIEKGMDKETVAYLFHGILHSHKKNEIVYFATKWFKLQTTLPREISQLQKNRCHKFSPI